MRVRDKREGHITSHARFNATWALGWALHALHNNSWLREKIPLAHSLRLCH